MECIANLSGSPQNQNECKRRYTSVTPDKRGRSHACRDPTPLTCLYFISTIDFNFGIWYYQGWETVSNPVQGGERAHSRADTTANFGSHDLPPTYNRLHTRNMRQLSKWNQCRLKMDGRKSLRYHRTRNGGCRNILVLVREVLLPDRDSIQMRRHDPPVHVSVPGPHPLGTD